MTNTVDPGEGAMWGAMLVAMAAMFVAALAVPAAFGRHALVFGVAFLIVHVMHVALYALGGRGDPDLLAAVSRMAPSALVGAALIIVAAFVQSELRPVLHLPMVVGIVLFALAMKKTLAHVGDELDTIPALGLCGGLALYLSAYVALRLRVARTPGRGRFVGTIVFVLLLPVAVAVPALVALALVAAVWVALHTYEIIWWREVRARTRTLRLPASAS